MVRWLKPEIDRHDFLYLSFLAIAGSGLVTLLLFWLYSWLYTGQIPVLDGIPSMDGTDGARFWIGSTFVPVLLAFSGIAIAHRLVSRRGSTRLSPGLDDGMLWQMSAESESGTMEHIMDVLSGPDAANTAFWVACKADSVSAGWRGVHRSHQLSGHYDMSFMPAADHGPAPDSSSKPGIACEALARDEGATRLEPADSRLQRRVEDVQPQPDNYDGKVDAPPGDPGEGSIPCSPAARAEATTTDKNMPAEEMDFIEQLKDPVFREKLVDLLTGIEA